MLVAHVPTGGGFLKFSHNLSNGPSPSRPRYTGQRIPVTPAMDWQPSLRPPDSEPLGLHDSEHGYRSSSFPRPCVPATPSPLWACSEEAESRVQAENLKMTLIGRRIQQWGKSARGRGQGEKRLRLPDYVSFLFLVMSIQNINKCDTKRSGTARTGIK